MESKSIIYSNNFEIDQQGYRAALLIDAHINYKLERQNITKETALEWLHFARTIKTTCEILEMQAMKVFKE